MKPHNYVFSNLCGPIYSRGEVIFTPDGNSIICPVSNRVAVYDLLQNTTRTLPVQNLTSIHHLALSPLGNALITVDADGRSLISRFPSGFSVHSLNYGVPIDNVIFSPNAKYFVSSQQNRGRKVLRDKPQVFENRINSTVISNLNDTSSRKGSSGYLGGGIKIWVTPSFNKEFQPVKLKRAFLGKYHTGKITCLDWNDTSDFILTSSMDTTATIFMVKANEQDDSIVKPEPVKQEPEDDNQQNIDADDADDDNEDDEDVKEVQVSDAAKKKYNRRRRKAKKEYRPQLLGRHSTGLKGGWFCNGSQMIITVTIAGLLHIWEHRVTSVEDKTVSTPAPLKVENATRGSWALIHKYDLRGIAIGVETSDKEESKKTEDHKQLHKSELTRYNGREIGTVSATAFHKDASLLVVCYSSGLVSFFTLSTLFLKNTVKKGSVRVIRRKTDQELVYNGLKHVNTVSLSKKSVSSCAIRSTANGDWLAVSFKAAPGNTHTYSGGEGLLIYDWVSESVLVKQLSPIVPVSAAWQGLRNLPMRNHFDAYNSETQNSGIRSMDYSPDSNWIVTGDVSGNIKIWNVSTGFNFFTFTSSDLGLGANVGGGAIMDVRFSKGGKSIFASISGSSSSVKAFDLVRFRNFKTFIPPQPQDASNYTISKIQFNKVALDSTGEILAVSALLEPFEIYIYSVQTGKLIDVCTGHTGPISALAFNPQLPILASSSWDKSIKIFNFFTKKSSSLDKTFYKKNDETVDTGSETLDLV